MTHYLISYDLHNQRHYDPVWELLGSWGAVRLLESLWLVTRNETIGATRESLSGAMDEDDAVIVIELKSGSQWASRNARSPGTDWLTAKLQRY
jgi:hypothetical protein